MIRVIIFVTFCLCGVAHAQPQTNKERGMLDPDKAFATPPKIRLCEVIEDGVVRLRACPKTHSAKAPAVNAKTQPFDNCRLGSLKSYLGRERHAALALYITAHYGLEVPFGFDMPETVTFADDNEGVPAQQRVPYFSEGGTAWPRRTLVWLLPRTV